MGTPCICFLIKIRVSAAPCPVPLIQRKDTFPTNICFFQPFSHFRITVNRRRFYFLTVGSSVIAAANKATSTVGPGPRHCTCQSDPGLGVCGASAPSTPSALSSPAPGPVTLLLSGELL